MKGSYKYFFKDFLVKILCFWLKIWPSNWYWYEVGHYVLNFRSIITWLRSLDKYIKNLELFYLVEAWRYIWYPGTFQRDVPIVLHHKNLTTDEQVISIGDLTMFMQGRNYPLIRYLKNITKILNHLWVILKFSLCLFPQNNYLLK